MAAVSLPSGVGRRRQQLRGLLIKGAEVAFRGGGPSQRAVQTQLAEGLLEASDVVLQDTQSSIRWSTLAPFLRRYRATLMPLGVYIGPDEAIGALLNNHRDVDGMHAHARAHVPPRAANTAHEDALEEEVDAMRQLWRRSPTWRSLRGLRFGYCHGAHNLNARLVASRRPLSEPATVGDEDVNERGGSFYCGALLAWRGDGR